ncbi:hypothetical protein [Microbispora sp. CA-102843]|uniref:hypothetical protein n=1 Tax=Microbispora sp. CA-102843 TaxID=3239952 RepID=UPI003D90D817
MYGSRIWLWLSTKRRLVDDVAQLQRVLDHTEAQLVKEREAAIRRRLPADLAIEADTAVTGREGGLVVDELQAAAAIVRSGVPDVAEKVREPWADWLDDHAVEHAGRDCMFAPDVCPAARTARALIEDA